MDKVQKNEIVSLMHILLVQIPDVFYSLYSIRPTSVNLYTDKLTKQECNLI